MSSIKDIDGKWLFITPISNVVLTDIVNKELIINRVIFIDSLKFLRVKKKFGINISTKEIKKFLGQYEFFGESSTLAVIHHSGKISESKCISMTNDAINILSSSQLIYIKRPKIKLTSILNDSNYGSSISLYLSKDLREYKYASFKKHGSSLPYELNKNWNIFQKRGFFIDLLKIINHKVNIDKKWRNQLIKVSILMGKSLLTDQIVESFLWNMIALETLLLNQGDKYTEAMPKRIEAILGWILDMEYHNNYLESIYLKRNKLVHDGDSGSILEEDVLFTDNIIFNLLMNIVKHPDIFKSKNELIDFAEKVRAENILGIKSKRRPKGFSYLG